jgi:U32 family peptidase
LPIFLGLLDDIGVDAVICSDLGVVGMVRRQTRLPVHISTQASVLNSDHARFWKQVGAQRIVVGRELSIDQAATIKAGSGLEVEMFVHGAMCVSYSGHCSLSTYINGRDANRGGCIQNCRFLYTLYPKGAEPVSQYLLASPDLCGIRLLDRFRSAGIDALKIEGRMKSSLYVASVVRAYAGALRELAAGETVRLDYWTEELRKFPHRGYTEGFLQPPEMAGSFDAEPASPSPPTTLAGAVLEAHPETSRFAFQVGTRLYPGDEIDILPFSGDAIRLHITSLTNLVERPLSVAQPGTVIWLPWQEGIEAFNIARITRDNRADG